MSDSGTPSLPEFDRPPVVETVLSAQFEPIAEMRTVHFGLFWQRIRSRFPEAQDRPALVPVFEQFGERPKRGPRLRFEAREDLRPERTWFLNQGGTEMIQLQADRFIRNWRKTGDDSVYPRYEPVIKPGFQRDFGEFEQFLKDEALGAIKMNQCEVTYVNHIVAGDGWEDWNEAARIFSFLGGLPAGIEDGAFALRLPIRHGGHQVGRLLVDIQPSLSDPDEKPMYVMSLTARGLVGGGTQFFDVGREVVVAAFAALTAASMHEIWGRRR